MAASRLAEAPPPGAGPGGAAAAQQGSCGVVDLVEQVGELPRGGGELLQQHVEARQRAGGDASPVVPTSPSIRSLTVCSRATSVAGHHGPAARRRR